MAIDFIDNVSGATGKDRLVSEDPLLAAQSRIWADKVNRDCCSPYYGVLVRKEDHERREHFEKLIGGLEVSLIIAVLQYCTVWTKSIMGCIKRTMHCLLVFVPRLNMLPSILKHKRTSRSS